MDGIENIYMRLNESKEDKDVIDFIKELLEYEENHNGWYTDYYNQLINKYTR